jgi:hypothetical protein
MCQAEEAHSLFRGGGLFRAVNGAIKSSHKDSISAFAWVAKEGVNKGNTGYIGKSGIQQANRYENIESQLATKHKKPEKGILKPINCNPISMHPLPMG